MAHTPSNFDDDDDDANDDDDNNDDDADHDNIIGNLYDKIPHVALKVKTDKQG